MHCGRCNDCALSRSFARVVADFDGAVVIAKITCHGTTVAHDRSMSSHDQQRRIKVSLFVFIIIMVGFLLQNPQPH